METTDEEDDLKLVKASAGLLADLEQSIPKLLWKKSKSGRTSQNVHTRIKKRDLDNVTGLIELFQGEPQLLDSKLKTILPPIIDAYLACISREDSSRLSDHADVQTGICSLLYTLCKVRGAKVIVGFFNNEPKYIEPVLEALERTLGDDKPDQTAWQVPYILLMWLSHLLLAPFDLTSISNKPNPNDLGIYSIEIETLPPLASRVLSAGLHYLRSATKAQDGAASMLVRLSTRPDILHTGLANVLVTRCLTQLAKSSSQMQDVYETLGSLRLVSGSAAAPELSSLVPGIYHTCEHVFDDVDGSALSSNAVAKKIVVKIFRNIATLSLHSMSTDGPLLSFLQSTDVLENVIDYLLRSLSDKDTPVRYAAAKALSLIVLELELEMRHEVIQAILDSFKEDMPRSASTADFTTTNPLKWHGLTLALAHTLFKRSASPAQLPDILNALIFALQYEQRTATGSSIGTNVRDAANFGIWSVARRYTTAELLSVTIEDLQSSIRMSTNSSVIQSLATELILSACLDPAGNIRRGSSAALQELVGRHPNQVHEGISLVQVVDYQAVSLRTRAMVDVVNNATNLHESYWNAALHGLFGWRGLGSPDVLSREGAARSISRLSREKQDEVLGQINSSLIACSSRDVELLHGLMLAAAFILEPEIDATPKKDHSTPPLTHFLQLLDQLPALSSRLKDMSPRMLRSEFPAAMSRLMAAICDSLLDRISEVPSDQIPIEALDSSVERLLIRHEDWILQTIPHLAISLLSLKRKIKAPLGCLGSQTLAARVAADGSKSTLHSAGGAIALGALAPLYDATGLGSDTPFIAVKSLTGLMHAMNVDWRIIGAKAVQLLVNGVKKGDHVDEGIANTICAAVHEGLNDYTIDERGDVGSLVRLQSILCVREIFGSRSFKSHEEALRPLKADTCRLSLEKLDRVRVQAAQCRSAYLDLKVQPDDVASVSSREYFEAALHPMIAESADWIVEALLEGCMSCAGVGAESLLQNSREALLRLLQLVDNARLEKIVTAYSNIMKAQLTSTANTQPSLELLAFLLDMHQPQRLVHSTTFKWRNLLATVQKSHHKSNDIPKLLSAVHVYIGLSGVSSIRHEVLKKLVSMLKTNPYPRVRVAVAEAIWLCTREERLKASDWSRPTAQHADIIRAMQETIKAD